MWNSIFVKDCNAQNPEEYRDCLYDRAEDHDHSEKVCAIYANLKTTNSELLGHNVNVNLSRWLASKQLRPHISIMAIDYFETSNLIADAVDENSKKPDDEPNRTPGQNNSIKTKSHNTK